MTTTIKSTKPDLDSDQSKHKPLQSDLEQTPDMGLYERELGVYSSPQPDPIIIVGSGPVGIRCAELLAQSNPHKEIILYSSEKYSAYNRIKLSDYLAGSIKRESLNNQANNEKNNIKSFYDCHVTSIDPNENCIIDETGRRQTYSKLIIATGASPRIPDVKGLDKNNIYTLRTLQDAERLIELKKNIKHLLIIGGGFLGIETAAAMQSKQLKVTLISNYSLLNHYIDSNGSQVLQDYIHSLGVDVQPHTKIDFCKKRKKGYRVTLKNGGHIDCDAIFAAIGTTPNIDLAKHAGIKTDRGIVVDSHMRTSCRNIYAVGDCAEHAKQVLGLVSPGYQQADSLVAHIKGQSTPYTSSRTNTHLKILDKQVAFYGDLKTEYDEALEYCNPLKGEYRRILIRNKRIIGYTVVGTWEESLQIKSAINEKRRIYFWQKNRFRKNGHLWTRLKKHSAADLPSDYIICLCKNVTRGAITESMNAGNRTMESLCQSTSAGVTCGSCRPLLGQILQTPVEHLVMRHHRKVLWTSVLSMLVIVAHFVFNPFDISLTVQGDWKIEKLWFDSGWKQTSGYALLSFFFLGAALALRKRWPKLKLGNLDNWRALHGVIGSIALVLLLMHTGFRLGENLNMFLMVAFLLATFTGSAAGILMATSHHWPQSRLELYRRRISQVHHIILWTIPSLLLFHIISVYYF